MRIFPPATAGKKKKDTTEEEWNKAKADVGKGRGDAALCNSRRLTCWSALQTRRDFNAEAECRDNAVRLEETLESFGIPAKVMQGVARARGYALRAPAAARC